MVGRVYMIISPMGRIYVGSTIKTYEERWKYYYNLNCKRQRLLYRSFIKYGVENHIFKKIWVGNIKNMLKNEAILGRCFNVLDPYFGLNLKLPKESDIYSSVSEEARKNMSNSKKGKTAGSKNYFYGKKGELSSMFGKIGDKHHNFGKPLTDEWRKNASDAQKIPIIQMDLEGNFIREWESTKDAGEKLKIHRSNITACCKGKYNHAGGFKWKHKE